MATALSVAGALPLAAAQTAGTGANGAPRARVALISDHARVRPGASIQMGLLFEMDPGWHIYWRNPGDAGIAPQIVWDTDSGTGADTIAAFDWPVPELLPVLPGEIMDYGYSGQAVLPFGIEIANNATDSVHLHGEARYLICKTICRPETAAISLQLPVNDTGEIDRRGQRLVAQARNTIPVPFFGKATLATHDGGWLLSLAGGQLSGLKGAARFFPYDHSIVHAASQAVYFGPDHVHIKLTPDTGTMPETLEGVVTLAGRAVTITAQPGTVPFDALPDRPGAASRTGLPILILFALLGGLILNFMPCVLPVLSIKAVGLITATPGEARQYGLWYTAGVLTGFAGFAAAIIALRALTGIAVWGFWLQSPFIVASLIVILFLIGLWLLGMIEPTLPVQNIGGGLAAKSGNIGTFFTGMLAAVAGAPCTGPFLGVTIGAVMLLQPVHIVIIMLAIGLGLALPFLILSFIPGLHHLLPRPGAWSGILKQIFAFPVFLTSAWLLVVLEQLAGGYAMALVITGIIMTGFAIWAFRAADQGGRVILTSIPGFLLLIPVIELARTLSNPGSGGVLAPVFLIALSVAIWQVQRLGPQTCARMTRAAALIAGLAGISLPVVMVGLPQSPGAVTQRNSQHIEGTAWSPERVNSLIAEGRPVFVDFTAAWCVTCQVNKVRVLQTHPVVEAFDKAGVAVLVADFTRHDEQIARELQKYGRAGVPMYLWYPPGESTPRLLPEILSTDLITSLAQTP